MKAITFHTYGPTDVLRYEEVPVPGPKKDEILIKVVAASVNPKDVLIRKGKFKSITGKRFPKLLGSDFCGLVEKVGSGVNSFAPGERVYGMLPTRSLGACAQYVAIKATHVGRVPNQLNNEEAAAIPLVALTALQALRDLGKLQPGQQLCINGASGGVGTLAIQIGKAMGAEVTAISSFRNSELCKSLGADHLIDYTKEEVLVSEKRFDLFFDVFGNLPFKKSRHLLTPKGIHISTIPRPSNFLTAFSTRFSAQKAKVVVVKASGADMQTISDWVERGKLKAVMDRVYPMEKIADAHAYVETKRTRGKVVLTVSHPS